MQELWQRQMMRMPSAKRAAAWLLKHDDQLAPEALAFVDAISRRNPDLTAAGPLAQELGELARQRCVDDLDDWIARATAQRIPRKVRVFAKGLRSTTSQSGRHSLRRGATARLSAIGFK